MLIFGLWDWLLHYMISYLYIRHNSLSNNLFQYVYIHMYIHKCQLLKANAIITRVHLNGLNDFLWNILFVTKNNDFIGTIS